MVSKYYKHWVFCAMGKKEINEESCDRLIVLIKINIKIVLKKKQKIEVVIGISINDSVLDLFYLY